MQATINQLTETNSTYPSLQPKCVTYGDNN